MRTTHVQAQGIVDTVADPLLVLDGSLCVQAASLPFFRTFKVDRYETIGEHIYDLAMANGTFPSCAGCLQMSFRKPQRS
jgi:hypothetical protein